MSKWADWIKKNAPDFRVQITNPMFVELMQKAKSYGKSFIEYGFGTGYTSIALANEGYDVVGYDKVGELVSFANTVKHTYLIEGKGSVKFTDDESSIRQADVVFSQGLLEHYDDSTIIDILKAQIKLANKAVVFSVPSDKYPYKDMGDERKMSVAQWEAILKPVFGDDLYELYSYCDFMHIMGVIKCQTKTKETKKTNSKK